MIATNDWQTGVRENLGVPQCPVVGDGASDEPDGT